MEKQNKDILIKTLRHIGDGISSLNKLVGVHSVEDYDKLMEIYDTIRKSQSDIQVILKKTYAEKVIGKNTQLSVFYFGML